MNWIIALILPLAGLSTGGYDAHATVASPPAVTAGDDAVLDARVRDFRKYVASGTREEQDKALEALLATDEDEVLTVLVEGLGSLATARLKTETRTESLATDVEHQQRLVEDLERRAQGDEALKRPLVDRKRELKDAKKLLEKRKDERKLADNWYGALRDATIVFRATRGASVAKRIEKSLLKSAKSKGSFNSRHGAIRVLGHLGNAGTAVTLQKLITSVVKARTALQKSLPKQMVDVRAMEQRMQEEAVRTGGSSTLGNQYDRLIKEANKTQADIGTHNQLCEALLLAGGEALSREGDKTREKTITTLFRAEKKGRNGGRQYSQRLLGSSGLPEVREAMHAMLLEEPDPLVRVNLVEALMLRLPLGGEPKLESYLLDVALADETWLVKTSAARALAQLRSPKAIPRILELLEGEEGRTADEFFRVLGRLTGLTFHGNLVLWDRWWQDNKDGFTVPTPDEVLSIQAARKKKALDGTGFFGIRSDSKHVLFVLDLSGSMVWSMVPHADDEPGRGSHPEGSERSRLEEAKSALMAAIGHMGREGTFNMIFYASDVWSWKPDMQPMTDKNVKEALESISGLKAVGGTNIYGALRSAMDMAETETTDFWAEPIVDTIFFLSDGQASVGITTDADEILDFVRERNDSGHIAIHTVGLSGSQDAYLLASLARQNDGVYVAR